MKPVLTKAELHFLLGKANIDKTHIKQLEYLETGIAMLRALKIIYPERIQTLIALFILLSIFNPLEYKFVTPFHPQVALLVLTIVSNGVGLFLLHKLGAGWITKGLNCMRAGLLPTIETYRSAILSLVALLFLIPGITFSMMGIALAIPPVTNLLADRLERLVIRKFESA